VASPIVVSRWIPAVVHPIDHDDDYDNDNGPPSAFDQDNQVSSA
jgi:hypothetical protein